MAYSRWMSLDPTIHHRKLANICLPMTHDSGTFDLSDELAPDPAPWIVTIQKVVYDVAKKLNDAHILPYGLDPLVWGMAEVIAPLKGLTTATKKTVAEQLANGVRGFDFRLFNDNGTYRIYHGLRSTSTFESMLDDIEAFLADTTRPGRAEGEILYVCLSHYLGFSDSDLETFGAFVKKRLGDYAYLREIKDGIDNNPFDRTYLQIIGQGGSYKSRVILVSSNPLGDDKYFWPQEYSPPNEHRKKNVLAGRYTDTSELRKMIPDQVGFFQTAVKVQMPCATYMTLTPSKDEYINIIVSNLYGALILLATEFPDLAPVVLPIALGLAIDHAAVEALGWHTLEQLSSRVNRRLPEIIDDHFVPLSGSKNWMSMIFCDFFEHSQVVPQCVVMSNDYDMQWGGNDVVEVNGTKILSNEGPTAAMFAHRLHMIYQEGGGTDLRLAVYDPFQKKWISDQKIKNMPGGTFDPKTDACPSCAVLDDLLYVVWKTVKEDSVRVATYDGEKWSGGAEIQIASPGRNPKTNESPFLARYGDELVMVHKFSKDSDIHWERFANGVWSGGNPIEVTDNSKKKPGTNERPAIAAYAGKLYLVFKGAHSNELYECFFDGSVWTGNRRIRDRHDKFTPKSNQGPGLASFGGSLYMIYKGEGHDDLWISTFNGLSWEGNVKLGEETSISPKSKRCPWLVRVGADLFLLNSYDGKIYESALAPKKFGT